MNNPKKEKSIWIYISAIIIVIIVIFFIIVCVYLSSQNDNCNTDCNTNCNDQNVCLQLANLTTDFETFKSNFTYVQGVTVNLYNNCNCIVSQAILDFSKVGNNMFINIRSQCLFELNENGPLKIKIPDNVKQFIPSSSNSFSYILNVNINSNVTALGNIDNSGYIMLYGSLNKDDFKHNSKYMISQQIISYSL